MKKKNLRELFPSWASQEALIKRIREEYDGDLSETDIYRNKNGDVVLTLDLEHIIIFPDDQRPGLYVVARQRFSESAVTYSDANTGLAKF